MGKATASYFVMKGLVAIMDINKTEGKKTVNEININNEKAFFFILI